MDPDAENRTGFATDDLSLEAIRLAVNIAQSECVCQLRLAVCLLTDAVQRAGIQPFLYETGLLA